MNRIMLKVLSKVSIAINTEYLLLRNSSRALWI